MRRTQNNEALPIASSLGEALQFVESSKRPNIELNK